MIAVEEALARILAACEPLGAEVKPPLAALGQVLAEAVAAGFDSPPHDNAAMDGYAVRQADLAGATETAPRSLRVVDDVPAGRTANVPVTPGTAVRIMTGAPLPPGADTVVPFEDTDERAVLAQRGTGPVHGRGGGPGRATVALFRDPGPGKNIRRRGEDMAAGSVVLPHGTEIRPVEVGVLAALGRAEIRVVRRPRVAILSTGDELVAPGEPLAPGQIYDANSTGLAAMVLRYGGVPVQLGIARDTVADLRRRVRLGTACDMLITSAGVSKGDYDMVKDVLAAEGEIDFWQVSMKPARPLAFGRLGGVPLIGLPGNPVSSMVAFEQFCRPAILKLLGHRHLGKPTLRVRLAEPLRNTDGRRVYLRGSVTREGGDYVGRLAGAQGSGVLSTLARANALLVVPDGMMAVPAGEWAEAQMLDWPESCLLDG